MNNNRVRYGERTDASAARVVAPAGWVLEDKEARVR